MLKPVDPFRNHFFSHFLELPNCIMPFKRPDLIALYFKPSFVKSIDLWKGWLKQWYLKQWWFQLLDFHQWAFFWLTLHSFPILIHYNRTDVILKKFPHKRNIRRKGIDRWTAVPFLMMWGCCILIYFDKLEPQWAPVRYHEDYPKLQDHSNTPGAQRSHSNEHSKDQPSKPST